MTSSAHTLLLCALSLLPATACGGTGGGPAGGTAVGGSAGADAGGGTGAVLPPPDLSHTFDPVPTTPGQEITGTCQSWTLNNEAPFYVNRVVSTNDGGFHHSNWIWVPDNLYTGPDGTWRCADRGFDQIAAGAFGGVFFAQSTQAAADIQAFPPGVAFEVPAHARIIGDVHLLNTSGTVASPSLRLDVFTLPVSNVRVRLQPMAFTNTVLDIAPTTTTHAHMQCGVPQPDFDVYYVLPHFHSLGTGFQVDVAGGPLNGTSLFRSTAAIGEGWGRTYDPPFSVTGATGLGITCEYQNPRAATVRYGVGDQEMCVALLYTTGKKAGGTTLNNLTVTDTGGIHRTDALCVALAAP